MNNIIKLIACIFFSLIMITFSYWANNPKNFKEVDGYIVDRFGENRFYEGTLEEVRELVPNGALYRGFKKVRIN